MAAKRDVGAYSCSQGLVTGPRVIQRENLGTRNVGAVRKKEPASYLEAGPVRRLFAYAICGQQDVIGRVGMTGVKPTDP